MKIQPVKILAGSIALLALSASAHSQTIINPSFDAQPLSSVGANLDGAPTGWSFAILGGNPDSGVSGILRPEAQWLSPVNGQNVGYLYQFYAGDVTSVLFQNLGPVAANTEYTLTGLIGDMSRGGVYQWLNNGFASINLAVDGFGLLDIVGTTGSFTSASSPGLGVAGLATASWTSGAIADGNLYATLVFSNTGRTVDGGIPVTIASFDNLNITAIVIPEPTTLAMFFGAAAIAFVQYRRRRNTLAISQA